MSAQHDAGHGGLDRCAQRPAEGPLLHRQGDAGRVGVHVRPPSRRPPPRVDDDRRAVGHHAQEPGLVVAAAAPEAGPDRADRAVELTGTERRLLGYLAAHRERVVSKTQILTAVWGYDGFADNLVEVNVSTLRRKLEADGEPRVVEVDGSALMPGRYPGGVPAHPRAQS